MSATLTPYEIGELRGIFERWYATGATIEYRGATLRRLGRCPDDRDCWRVEIEGVHVDTFDSTTFRSVGGLWEYLDVLLSHETDAHEFWAVAFEQLDA